VNEPGLGGSFWPSEQQKLLLLTACSEGEASAEAWRLLRPSLNLEELEPGSFPVLPLVARQLERLGIEDEYRAMLAGLRRRTWYLNRLQLPALPAPLHDLEQAGGEPVVVGGWQFLVHYHRQDFGVRAVDGLEVLVRPDRIKHCVQALLAVGFAAPMQPLGGSVRLVDAAGIPCTLKTRLSDELSAPERGIELDDFRAKCIEIVLGTARTRALSPSDELVRVCLSGARTASPPSIVWVADALVVLHASGESIDWQRVIHHADRLRGTLRLRDALVYLRRDFAAAVPEGVLQSLEAHQPGRREVLAHSQAGRSRRVVAPRFLSVTADLRPAAALASLPTYLRDELGVTRRSHVPLEVARRLVSRARVHSGRRTRPQVSAE
jgi:hypothetical protein